MLAHVGSKLVDASHACHVLVDAIAEVVTVRLKNFISQGLGNTEWAFAKAGHASPSCLDATALEVKASAKNLGSQHLANIVWAFATAGHACQ
eukprot:10367441-Karenia_brevis.AAC.1